MTIAPVFIADVDVLKTRLRLSAITSNDAKAILDEAVAASAMSIFDRLGSAMVTTILATNAGTASQAARNRTKAELIEVAQVRLVLMDLLPFSWKEGTNSGLDEWNKEGFSRDMTRAQVETAKSSLTAQIEGWYNDLLAGEEETDDDVKISSIGPLTVPARPFDSARTYPIGGEGQEFTT